MTYRHTGNYLGRTSSVVTQHTQRSKDAAWCALYKRPRLLGLCWSRVPGLLPVSAASPSMDHEHRTICQPILEHQIRLSAPSSIISRPTCFSSSLRCCWHVGSAPFVRCRCDCLASSAPFTNIQTYLLIYLQMTITRWRVYSFMQTWAYQYGWLRRSCIRVDRNIQSCLESWRTRRHEYNLRLFSLRTHRHLQFYTSSHTHWEYWHKTADVRHGNSPHGN